VSPRQQVPQNEKAVRMKPFDPFTATRDEAWAQSTVPNEVSAGEHQWGVAQAIIKNRARYEQEPLHGVAECIRSRLVVPDWLGIAFLRQYNRGSKLEVGTWDEAFGRLMPPGSHRSTQQFKRHVEEQWKVALALGMSRRNFAELLKLSAKKMRSHVPATRRHVRGHKPYRDAVDKSPLLSDPFGR
jgi:hypothetical protein